MKNKILLIVTGVGCAGGLLYLSRTAEAPRNDQVQGIIGAKLLGRGSTVCVNKFQNTSGKQASLDGIDEELVGRLNNVGFKARIVAAPDSTATGACEAFVHGEVTSIKGKNRVEAEMDFRLVKAGVERPVMSSSAKGKSSEVRSGEAQKVAMALLPKRTVKDPNEVDDELATREALVSALQDVARQIEQQRPKAE